MSWSEPPISCPNSRRRPRLNSTYSEPAYSRYSARCTGLFGSIHFLRAGFTQRGIIASIVSMLLPARPVSTVMRAKHRIVSLFSSAGAILRAVFIDFG